MSHDKAKVALAARASYYCDRADYGIFEDTPEDDRRRDNLNRKADMFEDLRSALWSDPDDYDGDIDAEYADFENAKMAAKEARRMQQEQAAGIYAYPMKAAAGTVPAEWFRRAEQREADAKQESLSTMPERKEEWQENEALLIPIPVRWA